MAFAAGVFTRIYNWVTEQASSPIEIAKLDTQEEDFATAFNNCLLRDGTGIPTANTPWNSKKITGLAQATADGDALALGTGSFTGTLTGVTSASGTVYYKIAGGVCTLYVHVSISNTSNSTALTMTGLPAACQITTGATPIVVPCFLKDNSSDGIAGHASLAGTGGTQGTITFGLMNVSGSNIIQAGSVFTASGNKGLPNTWTITYPL